LGGGGGSYKRGAEKKEVLQKPAEGKTPVNVKGLEANTQDASFGIGRRYGETRHKLGRKKNQLRQERQKCDLGGKIKVFRIAGEQKFLRITEKKSREKGVSVEVSGLHSGGE